MMAASIDHVMQIRAAITLDMDKRWQPHAGQRIASQAVDAGCTHVFVQCGRKWGKTDWLLRKLVENCLLPTNDGELSFYSAYSDLQAKRIVWLERRIQKFCDPSLIRKVHENDMRVEYCNGRHLIVDGSNNWKQVEGIRPSRIGLDEFKRFKPDFWETMEPNLSVYNATAMFAGAPPDHPCQYTELAEFVRQLQKESGEGYFIRHPSWMNDKIPGLLEWLRKRYHHYVARGELHVWQREYEALYVPGGRYRIFPMFNRNDLIRSDEWFTEHVRKNISNLEWYVIADPANEATFAVLIAAIHPITKNIYLVDCVYENDRNLTSAFAINERVNQKLIQWNPDFDDWLALYDDNAAWWGVENLRPGSNSKVNWMPAGKFAKEKGAGISLIKDLLIAKKIFAHPNLAPLFDEMELYVTDEHGKPKKGTDHLIDDLRYLLVGSNYSLEIKEEEEIPERYLRDPWLRRALGTTEEVPEEHLLRDWTHDMFSDWRAYN